MRPTVLFACFRVATCSSRMTEPSLHLCLGEPRPEVVQDVVSVIATSAETSELRLEHLRLEHGPLAASFRGKGWRRIKVDVTRSGDRPRPEADGRAVALADGPDTHDEPPTAGIDPGLVRVHHHARIAQCGTLDGVFTREGGTEQQKAGRGKLASWVETIGELVGVAGGTFRPSHDVGPRSARARRHSFGQLRRPIAPRRAARPQRTGTLAGRIPRAPERTGG